MNEDGPLLNATYGNPWISLTGSTMNVSINGKLAVYDKNLNRVIYKGGFRGANNTVTVTQNPGESSFFNQSIAWDLYVWSPLKDYSSGDFPAFLTAAIRWETVVKDDKDPSCKSLNFQKLSTTAYSSNSKSFLPLGIIFTPIHDGYEDFIMIKAKVEWNDGTNWVNGNHKYY